MKHHDCHMCYGRHIPSAGPRRPRPSLVDGLRRPFLVKLGVSVVYIIRFNIFLTYVRLILSTYIYIQIYLYNIYIYIYILIQYTYIYTTYIYIYIYYICNIL